MNFDLAYYNTSYDELARRGLSSQVDAVLRAVRQLPCHFWPDKSDNQKGLSVLQSLLNEHLRQDFAEQGWSSEVVAYEPGQAYCGQDRCDFGLLVGQARLLMEVEFGNGGGLERDLMKFENAYAWGQLELAFLVCPTTALAKKIDSGLLTYSSAKDSISRMHPSKFQRPLVLVGVEVDDEHPGANWSLSRFTTPSQLSGTNSTKEVIFRAIHDFRRGVPLEDIGPCLLPSEQKVAREVSRRLNRPKQLAQGSCVEQGTLAF